MNLLCRQSKFRASAIVALGLVLGGIPSTMGYAQRSLPLNIVDVVLTVNSRNGEFSTLIAALTKAGLVDAVRDGKLTVFAPTDRAFARIGLNPAAINGLDDAGVKSLTNVLLYHVTSGRVGLRDLRQTRSLEMLNGDSTRIRSRRFFARINGTPVVVGIPASNGNIFVINSVLIPPSS